MIVPRSAATFSETFDPTDPALVWSRRQVLVNESSAYQGLDRIDLTQRLDPEVTRGGQSLGSAWTSPDPRAAAELNQKLGQVASKTKAPTSQF